MLMDGSRNPTVFTASSFAIAEGGVGCSPSTSAARAVTNVGPGAAALKYLDEDEEAEDPAPTAEDEKPAPEDDGDEHQAKRQACLARLGALVGSQIQVCMFSLPNPPQGGLDPSYLFNIAHLGFVGREPAARPRKACDGMLGAIVRIAQPQVVGASSLLVLVKDSLAYHKHISYS